MANAFDPSTLQPSATGRTGITLDELLSNVPSQVTYRPAGLRSNTQIAGKFPGMLSPGNIDLTNRPRVKNADGSTSTVRSASFGLGGKETLLPTVSDDGRILTDDQAVDQFRRTGANLGMFANPRAADAYATGLHNQQAAALTAPPVASRSKGDAWGDYLKTMQYLTQPRKDAGPDARRAMGGMPAGPRSSPDDVQLQRPGGGQSLMAMLFGGGGK